MPKYKAIFLYLGYYKAIGMLTDAQLGRLIRALMNLAISGEVPDLSDDLAVAVLFQQYADQMQRDFQKASRNAENGRKGGAPSGNSNANRHE